jgi:hypothetical protein
MVVGVGSCKIKVDCNFPLVKCTKFHQNWSKTVDLHTKQTNQPTNRHSVLYRCPRTGSPEKKGSLRANILTCILKKKSPISNDNREKTI